MKQNYLYIFVSFYFQSVLGLYFHIGENEKKCFIEDIPEETLVVGNYKVELYDQNVNTFVPSYPGLGMQVTVNDPDQKTLMSRNYAAEGRFTFTSAMAGEHILCLESNTTFWGGLNQLRVHLRISVGERANDYSEIAEKDKLSELQLRIRQLLDQADQIAKEQNYQRYREERFRETSDSTNSRVLWWALAQVTVLVAAGFWQMHHLKSFFKAKKLV